MNKQKTGLCIAALLTCWPDFASANAGVPMLALVWPAQWIGLLPIVLIEAAIFQFAGNVPWRQSVWPIAKANLLSTLVGIPLAWLALLVVQFTVSGAVISAVPADISGSAMIRYLLFPLLAAWAPAGSSWEIYVAFLILAIPFCAVSIQVEGRYLKSKFLRHDRKCLFAITRTANMVTYLLLCLGALYIPLASIR